ncbi:MAG TPA: FG-GAP-like repeat-containing protein [Candidatus Krumholzibacteria bacterium]|nr:FG-GAP-like repeat-containing protein [Candidatus Krumholzibacteria bacterium]
MLCSIGVVGGAWAQLSPFPGPDYLSSPGGPAYLLVSDLNTDGIPDLLSTCPRLGSLLLHEGLGNGVFKLVQTLSVAGTPYRVAVGDLDQDGRIDLVYIDQSTGTLYWSYANPPPGISYSGGGFLPEGEEATGLALTDFDGDGWLDAVVALGGGDAIAIHFNDGAGSLLAGEFYGVGDGPMQIISTVSPLNGEPRIILGQAGVLSQNVAVYDGITPTISQVIASGQPQWIESGPWDADALDDLFIVVQDGGQLQVHRALSDGTYQFERSVALEPGSVSMTQLEPMAGLRRLIVGEAGRDRLTLLEGDPGVSLSARRSWFVGNGFEQVVAADVNQSPGKEILVPLPDQEAIAIVRQNGEGLLAYQSVKVGPQARSVHYVAPGPDHPARVAVLHQTNPILRIFEPYDGSLRQVAQLNGSTGLSRLSWKDLDANGQPDLIALRSGVGVELRLADASGGFPSTALIPIASELTALDAGEIDGDGKVDLIVADHDASLVHVFLGDGTGSFTEGQALETALPPVQAALSDLDLDGYDDLVLLDGTNFLSIYYNEGGHFGSPIRPLVGSGADQIVIERMNADQYPDILVANGGTQSSYTTYVSTAKRVYSLASLGETTKTGLNQVKLADISEDGIADLIFTSVAIKGIRLRPGNGDGTFAEGISYTGASLVLSLSVGDVDGDQRYDVILLDGISGSMHLLLRNPQQLVDVAPRLLATRTEMGVELRTETLQRVRVIRLRDGLAIAMREGGQGVWRALDSSASNGPEEYSLLDVSGNELDRASVAAFTRASTQVRLAAPFPNPSSSAVHVRFRAALDSSPRVRLVDARGRVVAQLQIGLGPDGWYEGTWNGLDSRGRTVARGRYQVDLEVAGRHMSRPLTWLGR